MLKGLAQGLVSTTLSTHAGNVPLRRLLAILRMIYAKGALGLLAVDEAHCISSWGHDFRPAYRRLARLRQEFARIPLMALTATATKEV